MGSILPPIFCTTSLNKSRAEIPRVISILSIYLPLIIDTEAKQFFQLEEAVAFSRLGAIVKTSMHIKFCGQITVQNKVESIFPFHTCPMIIGQIVETGFQCNGSDNIPIECRLQLRTEIIL